MHTHYYPFEHDHGLDHENTGASMIASSFITFGIAFVLVGLRFWTRAVIVRKLGPADWCTAFSLVGLARCPALSTVV